MGANRPGPSSRRQLLGPWTMLSAASNQQLDAASPLVNLVLSTSSNRLVESKSTGAAARGGPRIEKRSALLSSDLSTAQNVTALAGQNPLCIGT